MLEILYKSSSFKLTSKVYRRNAINWHIAIEKLCEVLFLNLHMKKLSVYSFSVCFSFLKKVSEIV